MNTAHQLIEVQREREHKLFERAINIYVLGNGNLLDRLNLANDIRDHETLLQEENRELLAKQLTPAIV